MAVGEIRIGVPGTGAADFNTTAINVLTLDKASTESPLSTRASLGFDNATEPSNAGTTPIVGPSYTPKQLWTLAPLLTADEAEHLRGLLTWQKANKSPLRLIDEVDLITVLNSYNPRPLIGEITPTWGAGFRRGYGIYAVQLQIDGPWNDYFGIWSDSLEQARLATFTAVEL
jgi:hypothetical protein